MPLDLEAIRRQQEGNLDQFLANRPSELEAALGRTAGNVESSRNQFTTNTVNPLLARTGANLGINLGGAGAASNQMYQTRLGRALAETQAKQRLAGNQDRVSKIYENAFRRAKEANADDASAKEYAAQVAQDEARRQYQSSEFESKYQQSLRDESLRDYYAQQGLGQQDSGYEQALARALGGLAGTGLAAYGIYQMNKPGSTNSTPLSSGASSQMPSLRQQSGYTTGIDSSGRRVY